MADNPYRFVKKIGPYIGNLYGVSYQKLELGDQLFGLSQLPLEPGIFSDKPIIFMTKG